ncbi:GIY-YIG nuclease family protein [Halobellus rubicundus]|uniref:GIY-YIG nuclease family protein n=1 Tax=Halobellus rubicundus TaxID=2996466 RepID=A0ABD5MBS0_9EURY
MGLDDLVSGEIAKSLNAEDKRLIREFKLQEPSASKRSVVYGIYDRRTGELLYVGETQALIRRISDHFRTRSGSNLLALVEDDDEINIEGGREGNIWDRTAIKYVEVTGSRERRRLIEEAIEAELNPRYSSD